MPLIDRIKHYRSEKWGERGLLLFVLGWVGEEAKGVGKTYTSAELVEIFGVILGFDSSQSETPAAGTAGEVE